MSAIAILPARGGSRRIPRKNIKLFHGKPIIAHSIEAAKASGLFDLGIYVSSEDDEILRLALELGVEPLSRDTSMARDEVGTQELMKYHLNGNLDLVTRKVDYACCIYPCSPMMTAEDLIRAAAWLTVSDGQGYAHITGWFYFAKIETFLADIPIEHSAPMTAPAERYIDVNTLEDWEKARIMYAAWRRKIEGDTDGVRA